MASEKFEDTQTKKVLARSSWIRKVGGTANFRSLVDSGELVRVSSDTNNVEKEYLYIWDNEQYTRSEFCVKFSDRYFRGCVSSKYLNEVKL